LADRILAAAGCTVIAALLGECSSAAAFDQPPASVACSGDVIARGHVARIIDGRTFVLDDGREARLAAIEVPSVEVPSNAAPALVAEPGAHDSENAGDDLAGKNLTDSNLADKDLANEEAASENSPGKASLHKASPREDSTDENSSSDDSTDGLAALVSEADVVLRQAGPQKTDRYGRTVAYAFVTRDGAEQSVQADLIDAGLARVAARAGTHGCATELLRRESDARRAKLGLWARSYYDLLDAGSPAAVLAEQGRFALVEGQVVSVRESGATIYVNFGRRWTEDFTVTILKRNERSFTSAGLEPKMLAGRRVRVRGWIEERGGPSIEAARPEQIELADRNK
jgi:endonuclease YncB( thermonuclease family)